jgi:hypothetical protein
VCNQIKYSISEQTARLVASKIRVIFTMSLCFKIWKAEKGALVMASKEKDTNEVQRYEIQ